MDWGAFINNVSAVALVLFVIGIILVTIEMFIPGFGVAGISGTICLVLAVLFSADSFFEGLIMMLVIFVILGVLFGVVLTSLSRGKMNKTLVLNEEQRKEKGYISSEDLNYFIDKQGNAITDLRPSGSVDIEGLKLDVVSDGEYISKGTKVEIIKVQGNKIIVRKATK
ncbi:NfeD family protein [Clostridium polynesiense]|uniref:NfeD family protein n=1 Tax=Clostridium polynesiense TaxID=1325933 RepID=UPI0005913A00|nr:NfeD family protein [Clostridium polynesiense]